MILLVLGIRFHWVWDWSDTERVSTESLPSRKIPLDQLVGGDPGALKNADLRLSGEIGEELQGQLFHMEQLDGGDNLVNQVDRLSAMVGDLGGAADDAGSMDGELDLDLRARYFAHEVNGLVAGISGRAQRAVISGDADQARVGMEMAADVGIRVASLCEFFYVGSQR